jgi:uncharacterized protein (DUF2249 family)
LISRNSCRAGCNDNGGRATGPSSVVAAAMTVIAQPARDIAEPSRVFDARSVSRRLRHQIVYEALDSMPRGATLRYIGAYYPIGLMEQLVHRYEGRLTHRFVEIGSDRVVIDLSLD